MRKRTKIKWLKYGAFMIIGYAAHLFIEAFLVTNALKLVGITIPTFV